MAFACSELRRRRSAWSAHQSQRASRRRRQGMFNYGACGYPQGLGEACEGDEMGALLM
jgi:hypothetical protein